MRKLVWISLSAVSIAAALLTQGFITRPVLAASKNSGCQEGQQASGAHYQICFPENAWNGDLVLYAHGYVPAGSVLALPGEAEQFSNTVLPLGYAFATTSYRTNGLAVQPAQADLLDLVQLFSSQGESPRRIFLVGASEGGLITTLSIERRPDVFAGGVELCGPIGDFQDQVNYFGDFRVVFDALFPGLIPPDPAHIPESLVARWPTLYQNRILPALSDPANQEKVAQLFAITGAPFDHERPETIETTVRGALGYNIFATNDANRQLGGNPYENRERVYSGSADDEALNQSIERVAADPAAIQALEAYRTTGQLNVPLVAIHTTGDEIVPFFHLERYQEKVAASGQSHLLKTISVNRYGHCNFTSAEIKQAFTKLIEMADQPPLIATSTLAPSIVPPQVSQVDQPPTPTIQAGPTISNEPAADQNPLSKLWSWLVETVRGLVK